MSSVKSRVTSVAINPATLMDVAKDQFIQFYSAAGFNTKGEEIVDVRIRDKVAPIWVDIEFKTAKKMEVLEL